MDDTKYANLGTRGHLTDDEILKQASNAGYTLLDDKDGFMWFAKRMSKTITNRRTNFVIINKKNKIIGYSGPGVPPRIY